MTASPNKATFLSTVGLGFQHILGLGEPSSAHKTVEWCPVFQMHFRREAVNNMKELESSFYLVPFYIWQ